MNTERGSSSESPDYSAVEQELSILINDVTNRVLYDDPSSARAIAAAALGEKYSTYHEMKKKLTSGKRKEVVQRLKQELEDFLASSTSNY